MKKLLNLATIEWLILSLFVILVILVRIRLLDFPLERDEGEFAYLGQLMLQGIPPYELAYNIKFPGTYAMYALIMAVFGETTRGIHLGLAVANLVTIALLFFIMKRWVSQHAAIIAASAYALLSLSPTVFGFAAHATHFVMLFALGGFLMLLRAFDDERPTTYLWSGVLFSLACLMKQPGLLFCVFGFLAWGGHLILNDRKSHEQNKQSQFVFLLGGMALPLLVTIVLLHVYGVFERFFFWAIIHALNYDAPNPFFLFKEHFSFVIYGFYPLWSLAGIGLLITFIHPQLTKEKKAVFILFALCSTFSTIPGSHFYPHYFVMLLPAVAILIGVVSDYCYVQWNFEGPKRVLHYLGIFLFLVSSGFALFHHRSYLLTYNLPTLSKLIYGVNPFVESIEIARFIQQRTQPDDTIAVFGSEPQIYFYANRHSATGYIYAYDLMNNHPFTLAMQREMIAQVEKAQPKMIVEVMTNNSWSRRQDSIDFIFYWLGHYVEKNYVLAGVVELISETKTHYYWFNDALNHKVKSNSYLLIFEKVAP
ncbi:MAG: hypothetical protein BWK79_16620 [Beggiatoa sp. IS2]|nr:MAG: hypothetical protein BWK79_16620 [Beggiatoa sp. IS2]